METHGREGLRNKSLPSLSDASYDPDLHASLLAIVQQSQHFGIGNFGIVDEQFFFRLFYERSQLLARVHRTYQKRREASRIRLPGGIGFEQLHCLLNDPGVSGHQAKTAAVFHIERGVVEREEVQNTTIDDYHLVVVAHQVVCSSRHSDAGIEKAHLELPQMLLPAPVGISDQRM